MDAIEITPVDLAHLDDEEFLNDTIIDFYMKRAPDSALAQPLICNCRFFICMQMKYSAHAAQEQARAMESQCGLGRCKGWRLESHNGDGGVARQPAAIAGQPVFCRDLGSSINAFAPANSCPPCT